jgi:IclR family transcriptional regulator, KDG regulon repressor
VEVDMKMETEIEAPQAGQQTIQSLDKGLQVLELIAEADRPLTLHDLWTQLQWNKATILRILTTFLRRGYVRRDNQTKAYTIGIRIVSLYSSLTDNLNIQQLMRPYLEELVTVTGETAQIGIVVNGKVVFIDRVRGRNIISANTEIGQALPLHCTAVGKAYLAYLHQAELDQMIKPPLPRFTSRTLCTVEELKSDLKKVRQRGYAIDHGEYSPELRCVASPILDHTQHPIALIGISGPKSGLSLQKCEEFGKVIRQVAERISVEVGFPADEGR